MGFIGIQGIDGLYICIGEVDSWCRLLFRLRLRLLVDELLELEEDCLFLAFLFTILLFLLCLDYLLGVGLGELARLLLLLASIGLSCSAPPAPSPAAAGPEGPICG